MNWLKLIFGGKQHKQRANRYAPSLIQRQYSNARTTRGNSSWNPADSSADAELVSSLTKLRTRSRALVRDFSYAKRAKLLIVNNIIGTGIGLQCQVKTTRDEFNKRANNDIEAAWRDWSAASICHTGGRMSERQLERAAMGQVFEAGEVIVREHFRPFGNGTIPYALELIEAERICDELTSPQNAAPGNEIRMGVEVDKYYRPVAYHIRARHGSELRWMGNQDRVERVPADQIIHLAIIDRWPQSRGEPWMHTAINRMNDMDGYSEAEILRARSQAVRMGIIESGEGSDSFAEEQDDGSFEMQLEPNVVTRLNPGEKWIDSAPTAPNPQLDPFMRYMLREIGSGMGVSYASLSGDYSQSNYSSSRLALLDDRDLWRYYQCWFIDEFRLRVHRRWLQQAVMAGAIPSVGAEQYFLNPANYEAVKFKPRGWSWIDPTKEVEAYKEAIKAGLSTRTDVISQTGNGLDIEDIDETREHELEEAKDRGLKFDTDPDYYMADANKAKADAKAALKPPEPTTETGTDNAPQKAGRFVLGAVK